MGVFGEQVCDGGDRGAQGISDLETDLIEVGQFITSIMLMIVS